MNGFSFLNSASDNRYNTEYNNGKAATTEHHVVKRFLAGVLAFSCMQAASAVNSPPTVEMTAPAANTPFVAPAAMTLSATATDSDGTVASVAFYRGTVLIGTATTAPYSVAWTNVAAGTYTITSKARDDAGAVTESAPLTVTVNPNTLPTVSLTAPSSGSSYIVPATVALTATAADSDGTIVKVTYYRDATFIGNATVAPYAINWNNGEPGTYQVTARATDDKGGVTTSAPVTVTLAANVPPSVTISAPSPGADFIAPAAVSLTAVASDTDGSITRVDYYRDGSWIGHATAAPYAVNWSNAAAGSYALTAKATDNKGGTSTSPPVTVIVKPNALPSVAIATPADGASFASPGIITLKASAGDTDGTIVNVSYFNGATAIGQSTVAPYAITWGNVALGTYTVTARATDNKGGVTTSSPVVISVNPNQAPTIAVSAPATATAPAAIALSANAADSDGTIVKVDFYANTNLVGTVTNAPYAFSWTGATAGTHSITARVTDDKGAATMSAAHTVTVSANVAPTISITEPQQGASYYPGSLAIKAAATDTDGSVVKVDFYDGDTLLGTVTSVPYQFTVPNLQAGPHSLRAVATDDKGATGATSVSITVHPAPVPSVSIQPLPNNGNYLAPATITLMATATPAPASPDTIAKVEYISNGAVVGTATAAPYTVVLNNVAAGAYTVTARATGGFGGTGTSAPVEILVKDNAAPVVTLAANPGSGTAPANITLTANATDSDGSIIKVEFFNGDVLLGSATEAPYTYQWTNVDAGTYTLTARATDNSNTSTTSAVQSFTVHAPGQPGDADVYFVYSDQINTARVIVNAAGTKVWQADPDPFGANMPNDNPAGQGAFTYNPRFPGQYFDKETGLHYNYFRDYDPQTGRYVQSDPIGLAGGINTYGYVSGNPLISVDPLGLADMVTFNASEKGGMFFRGATAWNHLGAFTVGGHGNPYFMTNPDGSQISPEQLAERIGKHKNFTGQTIILGSCDTGRDKHNGAPGFAQNLADLLGVPVIAPTEQVWYTSKGMHGSGAASAPPPGTLGPWVTKLPREKK